MRALPAEALAVEITKRGDEAVIQAADKTVRVKNSEFVGQQMRQLPVVAKLQAAPDNSVRIQSLSLQATARWDGLSDQLKQRYRRVDAAQRRLAVVAKDALKADAKESDLLRLQAVVESTEQSIVQAYQTLPQTERSEQRVLVEQHREVSRANKALYGLNRNDRYPPETYERIYENSHASFALKRKDQDVPRCSAVLISEKYGLTNNHCIFDEAPEDFEAVFDYEDDLQGNRKVVHAFPVEEILLEDEQERADLDFVLLVLGKDDAGEAPGDVYKPQCLSRARVKRDDPLYVVGYPLGEPRTVHDNAFVYFPFVVTPEERARLEIQVREEFESIEEEDESYREGKLKEFADSYRSATLNGEPVYEYFSTRFGNQPTIGADSDTYHGNSGSPVYNRRTHAIIGLLFDGQEDLSQPWTPGWRAHEAVLPITEVIRQLDIAKSDWKDDPKVCIDPSA